MSQKHRKLPKYFGQDCSFHTQSMPFPVQTPGCSPDYEDHAENHSKDFSCNNKQQMTLMILKPNKKLKTKTEYPCSPAKQGNIPNWRAQKPDTIKRSQHKHGKDRFRNPTKCAISCSINHWVQDCPNRDN